ncbi:MAG TPA: hypothetical protein VFA27_13085 [Vicinamibacterales bacterium]|nr:hypothetical protein [Vicinamibacterales bacterium]
MTRTNAGLNSRRWQRATGTAVRAPLFKEDTTMASNNPNPGGLGGGNPPGSANPGGTGGGAPGGTSTSTSRK